MLKEINLNLRLKIETGTKSSDLVIVNSHERSGTHFLMNSIEHCFGFYKANPYLDFGLVRLSSLVNFYDGKSLSKFFNKLIDEKNSSIIKSHFNADFFYDLEKETLNKIKFLFIYREPISVLKSFWIFLHNCSWYEGPKINDFNKFCFSEPSGQMLTYQYRQYENFVIRYLSMIDGWLKFKEINKNILFISYDELNSEYSNVIKKIGLFLNMKVLQTNKFDRKKFFEVKFNQYFSALTFDTNNLSSIDDYIINQKKKLGINNTLFNF